MPRRHEPEPNHERWLVSYADFITLLFAFFVVMFASSQADKNKAKRVSEAVEKAFDGKQKEAKNAPKSGISPEKSAPAGLPSLEPSLRRLAKDLAPEIESGHVEVHMEQRGLVVSLKQGAFFPSGEDNLDPATYPTLSKMASAIRAVPNPVRLEGHTDAIPIHTPRFQSNWELSTARAIAVMNLLNTQWAVPSNQMAVTGYADTMPMDSNDSDAGRARNRRVDVVILNSTAYEPHPSTR